MIRRAACSSVSLESIARARRRNGASTEHCIHAGRLPEAIFVNHTTGQKERVFITKLPVEACDIQLFADMFDGEVPAHHRIGVEGTLHRISLIVHPTRSLMVRPPPAPARTIVLAASTCAGFRLRHRRRNRSISFHRARTDSLAETSSRPNTLSAGAVHGVGGGMLQKNHVLGVTARVGRVVQVRRWR
jgi:hypothetical protein